MNHNKILNILDVIYIKLKMARATTLKIDFFLIPTRILPQFDDLTSYIWILCTDLTNNKSAEACHIGSFVKSAEIIQIARS